MFVLGLMRLCSVGVLAALLLAGCTHDRSELYASATKDAGAAAPKPEPLPLLPMLPDPENVDACETCAKDKCADARASCLEDDACVENLACRGKCSDPACLQSCDAKYPASSFWFNALVECVRDDACATLCRSGDNFACVDNYAWPVPKQRRYRVRFRFTSEGIFLLKGIEPFLVGAQVRSCGGDWRGPCDDMSRLDSGPVDASDTVELGLIVATRDSRFGGFLEVEDDQIGFFGRRERLFPQFPVEAGELRLFPPDRDYIQQATGFTSLDLETAAPLAIIISDCMGAPAHVRVELPELPSTAVLHAKDGFDPALYNPKATNVGFAIVADVPEPDPAHPIVTQAFQVGTTRVVAERPAFVRAGWTTELWLTPRAR